MANRNQRNRNNKGMSLASVLAMGTVLSLTVSGLMATILPVFQKTGSLKNANTVRSMAELGLDYAVQQLNAGTQGWDCGNTQGTTITQSLPQSVTGDANASVSVRITNIGNAPNSSMLFDPILNQSNPNSFRLVLVTAQYGNTVKQLRALLQPIIDGGSGNVPNSNTDQANSPQFPYGAFGMASVVFAGQSAINTYNAPTAMMQIGADSASLGKVSHVYSSSSGLGRSIAKGGSQLEFPNPQSYYNQQFNIVSQTYNASAASTAPWMQLYGNLYSNGTNTAYRALATSDPGVVSGLSPARNVFGMANGFVDGIPTGYQNQSVNVNNTWGGNVGGAVTAWNVQPSGSANVTYPQPNIPAAPSAPSGSVNLGSINIRNGGQLIIDSSAAAPTGPIGTINNRTVRIPPASYIVNSLSMSGGSTITIESGTQGQITSGAKSPTQFYVQGTSTPATAVTIDNTSSINMSGVTSATGGSNPTGVNYQGKNGVSALTNKTGATASNQIAINQPGDASVNSSNIVEASGNSSQFQIYTSSQTNIVLQGNERMTLYAPYAKVTVGSLLNSSGTPISISNNANFYGAAVGANVAVQSGYGSGGGAFFHYDWKLRPAGMNFLNPWAPPAPYVPPNSNNTNGNVALPVSGYRAVSWQEAVNPNPGNPQAAQWYYP